MKDLEFDEKIRGSVRNYENTTKASIDKNEVWNTINLDSKRDNRKVGLVYFRIAAAIILLMVIGSLIHVNNIQKNELTLLKGQIDKNNKIRNEGISLLKKNEMTISDLKNTIEILNSKPVKEVVKYKVIEKEIIVYTDNKKPQNKNDESDVTIKEKNTSVNKDEIYKSINQITNIDSLHVKPSERYSYYNDYSVRNDEKPKKKFRIRFGSSNNDERTVTKNTRNQFLIKTAMN